MKLVCFLWRVSFVLISLSAGWGRFLLRHLVRARQAGGWDKGEDAGVEGCLGGREVEGG